MSEDYLDGKKAGLRGEKCIPPVGSMDKDAWIDGWWDGRREARDALWTLLYRDKYMETVNG